MIEPLNLLLAGGTVIDPASGRHEPLDVGVRAGKIAAVERALDRERAARVLDVSGCLVTPGLIDFHVHSYWGVNPYGMDADEVCLAGGVTTAVDAGSSGPVNFPGFRRFIAERSRTRMLAFVCVAQHGVLNGPGELEDLRFADPEGAAQTVNEHREVAVGIKVRLHEKVGDHGPEALRLAIQAGEASHSPVMVHIGNSKMPIEQIVDMLRPGDIVTHCFTPLEPCIVDAGQPRPAVLRAYQRGVLFDVGHATRHMSFSNVQAAMREGLRPHIVSTDLHGRANRELIGDLPAVMTKMLALGMSLDEVVAACTVNPARAIGWQDRLGRLEVGREADVSVLELLEGPLTVRDSTGAELAARQRLAPRWTVRAGEVSNIPSPAGGEG